MNKEVQLEKESYFNAAEDKKLLMSYYGQAEDWQLFKKICKFWNVK